MHATGTPSGVGPPRLPWSSAWPSVWRAGPLLITQQDYALTCVAERQLRKTIEAQLGVDLTERKALIRAEA